MISSIIQQSLDREETSYEFATEAISAGYYHASGWNRDYPRIQLLTIDELLHGATVQMPPQYGKFKQARRVHEVGNEQPELEMSE
jgi:site-specific DNA-methyltransferase (adenine-specific)